LIFVLCIVYTIASKIGRNNEHENFHGDPHESNNPFPGHNELKTKLQRIVLEDNDGLGYDMWACIVDRDGIVKNIVFSGKDRGSQFPGSRTIACSKANAANSFSIPGHPLSTANLYFATQPGGSLFGLQDSNPVNLQAAYQGPSDRFGKRNDSWIGKKAGGTVIFGGGLALFDSKGELIGAVGVSGDTSCTDHIIAWKLRYSLGLDFVPSGVSSNTDNIVNDLTYVNGVLTSPSGWGHVACSAKATSISAALPQTHPVEKVQPPQYSPYHEDKK